MLPLLVFILKVTRAYQYLWLTLFLSPLFLSFPPTPPQVLREETLALSLDLACFLTAHVRFGLGLCYGCFCYLWGIIYFCFKVYASLLWTWCNGIICILDIWAFDSFLGNNKKLVFNFYRCFIYVLPCDISVHVYLDNTPPKLVHSLCEWP